MRMGRTVIDLAFAGVVCVGFTFATTTYAASSFETLRKSMKPIKVLEASFTQEVKDTLFPGDEEKAEGRLRLERPDSVLWTYTKPEKRVIRYSKRRLEIEEGEHRDIVDVTSDITLEAAFSFLWGDLKSQHFSVKSTGPSSFTLLPKSPLPSNSNSQSNSQLKSMGAAQTAATEASFKKIDFVIKDGFVREASILSVTDSVSLLKFSDWKASR